MVMKTYLKSVFRSMKSNATRLISITIIILLGIAFVSGLGTLSPTMEESVRVELENCSASDMIIKSKSEQGFSANEIAAIAENDKIAEIQAMSIIDMQINGKNSRIYLLPTQENINKTTLLEGRMPVRYNEVVIERASDNVDEINVGDTMQLLGFNVEVVGIVANVLIFDRQGEPDVVNQEPLQQIAYFNADVLSMFYTLPTTDIYVRLKDSNSNYFTKQYKDFVNKQRDALQADLGDSFAYLTLRENKSFALLENYCDKVNVITLVFPVFFIAVAALVALTTMNRMVEEERPIIGCCATLGVDEGKIVFKYLLLAAVCCFIAMIIGMAVGLTMLPYVIYPAFNSMFFMPQMSSYISPWAGLIACAAMATVVLCVTAYAAKKDLKGQPAGLLVPKAPKAGKKIFLEKIPFIWKKLPFRYKSSFRNVFRYVNHLIMTVVSVAGSTALTFAGFALLNVSNSDLGSTYMGIAEAISPIAAVILMFALLLCAFVIYNLTNMNITERKREIATLKVLGYRDIEVAGYIFREVLIMALIGIFIGVPLGVGLIYFVLSYLDFGAISDVKWYSYLVSGGLVLLFVGIVDLLLMRKIKAIDMISSLKMME